MSAEMSQFSILSGEAAPLRVLVVDDEELARMRLKSLVGECGEPVATVVGEAGNAAQALVWLATRTCCSARRPGHRSLLRLRGSTSPAGRLATTPTAPGPRSSC